MTYELAFLDVALKEWRKLDKATREQFKAKLAERLENPKVPSARLHGAKERYKIKLRSSGFRLVYEVRDHELVVVVIAVGKRERNEVYKAADQRSTAKQRTVPANEEGARSSSKSDPTDLAGIAKGANPRGFRDRKDRT
jgi:mRNA interferase RelE/StbE